MSCSHDRPVVRHSVDGDLNIYSAAQQKAALLPVFRSPYSIVELDLGNVSDIDTAGVQLLILGCKVTAMVGASLRLVAIGAAVGQMIELLDLKELFAGAENHCPMCADDRVRNLPEIS